MNSAEMVPATKTIKTRGAGSRSASASLTALSLQRNFAWTLVGNAVYAACQWTIVVVLAKLGNSEMVGQLALAMAVAFPITLIANLQLRAVFVTDLENKYSFGEMLGGRFVLSIVAMALILLTCKFANYGAHSSYVIVLISLGQLVDCISENYYGLSQRYERMDRIAKSQMIRSALSLFGFTFVLYFTHSLFCGVLALIFGRTVVLIAYDAGRCTFALADHDYQADAAWRGSTLLARVRPQWNPTKQLEMIVVALPLGSVAIVCALSANIPRYAIQHYLGQRDLGIYSAINYIPTAGLMVTTALGNAAFASLSRLYFEGDIVAFRRLLVRGSAMCSAVGITGLVGSAMVGRQLLAILYRPEYAHRVDVLVWLMVAAALGSVTTFLGCAMTATSQFRVQLVLFLAVAACSALGCFLMIPRLGLTGAALAAVASMVVQGCGTVFVICRGMVARAHALTGNLSVSIGNVVEA